MAEEIVKEEVAKKKRPVKPASLRTKIMFAIGIAIILIPFVIVAVIVLGDAISGRKPNNGDRYKNDLNPAITEKDISGIKTDIEGILNAEKVKVELKTSTLRVYVDVEDSIDTEAVEKAALAAYDKVASTLPLNTYFKGSVGQKMYDLEIHVYTVTDKNDENFDYYILTRNSNTERDEGYVIDHVSVAKDEDLAKLLRGEVEDEVSSDGAPVDGGEEGAE